MTRSTALRRYFGFWTLVIYGVGDILGAGIYALVGEVAGAAGTWSWLAFVTALAVASLTGLCYGELGRRLPHAAGEPVYVNAGFQSRRLALLVGWLVLATGLFSLATVAHALAGYCRPVLPAIPGWLISGLFVLSLAGVTWAGIRESSALNIVCTSVEVAGLLFIIVAGAWSLAGEGPARVQNVPTDAIDLRGILAAAALAFFAFIGFEDMVKMSEETHVPERTMPMAILAAMGIAGLIYLLVVLVSTHVVEPDVLAASSAPMTEVARVAAPSLPAWAFTVVVVFAVGNTALLNFVTASRLLYGMARDGLLPAWLGEVHPTRQTPHRAIVCILLLGLLLALSGTLRGLAGTTSLLILVVFAVTDIGLVIIRLREGPLASGFRVPILVPLMGAVASLALVAFVPREALWRGLAFVATGSVLVLFHRERDPAPGPDEEGPG